MAKQSLRHIWRTTGDDDAIKRCEDRLAFVAIAVVQGRFHAHRFEQWSGGVKKGLLAFDAVHFESQRTEHSALVAAASANFKHRRPRSKLKQLTLFGNRVGLADRLACRNGKGLVAVRKLRKRRIEKEMARHGIHGFEDAFTSNAQLTQLFKKLAALSFVHVGVLRQFHGPKLMPLATQDVHEVWAIFTSQW